jgi:hypothetical protein
MKGYLACQQGKDDAKCERRILKNWNGVVLYDDINRKGVMGGFQRNYLGTGLAKSCLLEARFNEILVTGSSFGHYWRRAPVSTRYVTKISPENPLTI